MSVQITKPFLPIINPIWFKEIFSYIDKDYWDIAEEDYNNLIINKKIIFPLYKNIFKFTYYFIPSDVKICIIGQDPYHGMYKSKTLNTYLPEGIGLSFSVDKECPIPSSLQNIYKNQLAHSQILFQPTHGDLSYWAYQGVLMLNSALTVEKSKPNSCKDAWCEFTNDLVKILSEKYSGIIFLLWGKHAHLKKLDGVIKNQSQHKFVISSHPSGYSANSPYREFKSFMDTDHFGLANKYLIEMGKKPIDWQIM